MCVKVRECVWFFLQLYREKFITLYIKYRALFRFWSFLHCRYVVNWNDDDDDDDENVVAVALRVVAVDVVAVSSIYLLFVQLQLNTMKCQRPPDIQSVVNELMFAFINVNWWIDRQIAQSPNYLSNSQTNRLLDPYLHWCAC